MNLSLQNSGEWEVVRLALGRHQLRRVQGIPTLSVLVGGRAEAVAIWQDWTRTAGWHAKVQEADWREDEVAQAGSAGEAILYVHQSSGNEGEAGTEQGVRLAKIVDRLCRALVTAGADPGNRPLALAVEPAEAAAFLLAEPHSRAGTLFAEGVVMLPSVVDPKKYQKIYGSGTEGSESASTLNVPSLAQRTFRPEIIASFDAARVALRRVASAPMVDAVEDDRARSAAERFLFDLLGELPETAGVFELNVRLEFCFGPMRAEVDLLAAGLRLAVEIDGYYHFRDKDGYRRDRRKDAVLQRQSYLVLRFLAEDVVVRLEEILEEIRAAVAFRRATLR